MSNDIQTAEDYEEYEQAFAEFFKSEGIQNLSTSPDVEPHFSHVPCDCCKGHFAGNRFEAWAYTLAPQRIQGPHIVCEDCIYYATYGRLDDQTMERTQ